MNDMSAPKRAQQQRDADRPTYSTMFARTATAFHPAERILAAVAEFAPTIAARTAELEAKRRLPPDLIGALRTIGVFRMFAPRSHGGLEL
jgi:alkylation response protein AidB-like acyl-CoA dehydrogenase